MEPRKEPPEEWDENEQEAYWRLRRVHVHPSRLLPPKLMASLGLYDDISDLLKRMGLGFFIKFQTHHFSDGARQFFSTLEIKYENPRKKKPHECTINFKIENNSYTLTMAQICEAYGFPNGPSPSFPKFK